MSDEPDDIKYETDLEGTENASPKKAGFGKSESQAVAGLKEKLTVCLKEKQDYLDKWQRSTADFLNARKRDAEDNLRFKKYVAGGLMEKLLPVLDSFNTAFNNKEAWEKVDKNWRNGVEYIAEQLKKTLESNGLKELNPLGEKFDPMLHEAVEFEEVSDEAKNRVITEVLNRGYAFYDRMLRAPKVKIGEFKK